MQRRAAASSENGIKHLSRTSKRRTIQRDGSGHGESTSRSKFIVVVVSVFGALVVVWFAAAYYFATSAGTVRVGAPAFLRGGGEDIIASGKVSSKIPAAAMAVVSPGARTNIHPPSKLVADLTKKRKSSDATPLFPKEEHISYDDDLLLLSRRQGVTITAEVRGNLGPPSVLNQDPPGTNWISDRWQAASDMGGTAIPGSHWVVVDFGRTVEVGRVVLDWEAAYAKDYRLEGSIAAVEKGGDGSWCTFYDNGAAASTSSDPRISVKESGQSPGVKTKMPLHIVHTIQFGKSGRNNAAGGGRDINRQHCRTLRYLRVFVRKPARGWGVSLWQVDVYGFDVD